MNTDFVTYLQMIFCVKIELYYSLEQGSLDKTLLNFKKFKHKR